MSWKKSGGWKNFDSTNNLTANSITTDDFAMRNPYKGTFTISGELISYGDASFNRNIEVGSDTYVKGNIRLKQKLTMGAELERGATFSNFLFSDHNGMGLNIDKPQAVLDISGSSRSVLNVYSSSETTSNILARNKNNHNIALEVDNSNAQIVFSHSDVSSVIMFEHTENQRPHKKQNKEPPVFLNTTTA